MCVKRHIRILVCALIFNDKTPVTSTIHLLLNISTNQQPYIVNQSLPTYQPIRCMISMQGEREEKKKTLHS